MISNVRAKPLVWTDVTEPNTEVPYHHIIAMTPFGRFLVTWKGWKEHDPPTIDETPWGEWGGVTDSLDEARDLCGRMYEAKLHECLEEVP